MNIFINGETHSTHSTQLAQLVVELDLAGKRIAIEMNGELIPKSRHASTLLTENAKIEMIQAVGGG